MKRNTAQRSLGLLQRVRPALLGRVVAPVAATAMVACAGPADRAEPVPGEAVAQELSPLAIEAEVDALLASLTALDDLVRHGQITSRASAAYDAIERVVSEIVVASEALRAAPAAKHPVRDLARRAGQLAPQLRALRREITRAGLDTSARADLLLSLARVRVAAGSLDRRVSELHGALHADELRAATGAGDRRNGPLYPGSSYYVLDEGHIDPVDVAYEDGALGISIHDETVEPDVERDPATTIMVVKAAAKVAVPDARFAFLGPVGTTVWILPQGQLDAEAAGILWPGLAADEVEPGTFVGDTVAVRFKQVIGPNGLSIFESPSDETTPPLVLVDSEDGLPDAVDLSAGTHRHANWAFEAAGPYVVKVDVRGRLAGVAGNPWVTSSTAALKFVVLP
jgi:surface-anchored protein